LRAAPEIQPRRRDVGRARGRHDRGIARARAVVRAVDELLAGRHRRLRDHRRGADLHVPRDRGDRAMTRLAIACAFVAACATPPPQVSAADAQRANIALDQLQQGRTLLVTKCSGCHTTPLPSEAAASAWPGKLGEMAARAHLSPNERHLIELYLVVKATD